MALWALFEQRSVMSGGVAWVRGNELAGVLERRPVTFSQSEVDRAAAALRSATSDGVLS